MQHCWVMQANSWDAQMTLNIAYQAKNEAEYIVVDFSN